MEMHWFSYDIVIVGKVGKNTFIVNVMVNYLACIETASQKYRLF
jgi:hypothetical protein